MEEARGIPWLPIGIGAIGLLLLAGLIVLAYYLAEHRLPFARSSSTPAPAGTPAPAIVLELSYAPAEPKVGEVVTVTLTITNTGDQPWTVQEYYLRAGGWEKALKADTLPSPGPAEISPNGSHRVDFTFTAQDAGEAKIAVLVRVKKGDSPPESVVSKEISLQVSQ